MVWTYNSRDGPPTITVSTNIDFLIAQWLCEHLWPVTDTMTGMSYNNFNTGSSRLNTRKKNVPIVYVFACECVGGCTWGASYIGEEGGQKHGTRAHKHMYTIYSKNHWKTYGKNQNWSHDLHTWRCLYMILKIHGTEHIFYIKPFFPKLKPMLYAPIHPA